MTIYLSPARTRTRQKNTRARNTVYTVVRQHPTLLEKLRRPTDEKVNPCRAVAHDLREPAGRQRRRTANGDTLKTIADTKTIRMGYLRESVPFSFVDQNGDPSGYSIDLCKRVAAGIQQQLNLPEIAIKWVPVTLANRFDLVSSGGIDLECGTSTNSLSRQKQVDFSVMTWVDGGNFVVKAGQPHHSLADLAGKKIAVVAGTTTESGLRAALKKGLSTPRSSRCRNIWTGSMRCRKARSTRMPRIRPC